MKRPNLLIAGGGTGGHIAPAIAVGNAARQSFSVSYACTPRPVDRIMYSEVKETVHVMNPPRLDRGMKLLFPLTATASLLRALKLLKSNRIDAVLGTGGYSSFFAIMAARILNKPATLLDTNAIPGRSNRIASRFCRVAFTGFPGGERGLRCPSQHTGTPVSASLEKHSTAHARRKLGLDEDRPVVLFLGGSQGARAVNDLALEMPGELTVLLQCGKTDLERAAAAGKGRDLIIEPFLKDLSLWYSAAELAVARAGGQTIAELSAFGLPAVLIPYPYAADDHQTANAAVAERAGAAILSSQGETTPTELSRLLLRLLSTPVELDGMRRAMGSLYPPDPAGEIARHLLELVS